MVVRVLTPVVGVQ